MAIQAELALGYDLGGTKVAVAAIDARGRIHEEIRQPVVAAEGKAAVLKQLVRLGREMISRHPRIRRVGIAAAGPLDPTHGVLLDPTNFVGPEGTFGIVKIVAHLEKHLKLPVTLENDAAAAMLAEHWLGHARGYDNAMILTLGTGLGTGIICNGALVRAGRGMHPEAGHLIINSTDASAPCGCGNLGCAEAYLSGRSFTRRARARLGDPSLDAAAIATQARKGHALSRQLFEEYAVMMATAIHNYVVIYCPEIVVLTGSFAAASDLFLKSTRRELEKLLERRREGTDLMPAIEISALDNQAGVLGAAHVAFHAKKRLAGTRAGSRPRAR
jgi:glucokinase